MTMLGSDIPFQMFYTDNMYYMDMMGMKMKQEMPLDEALDQVASNLESVDMDLAMMKDMAMTTEDGNTVLTYGINTDNMNSLLNGIVGDMDTLYNGYTVSRQYPQRIWQGHCGSERLLCQRGYEPGYGYGHDRQRDWRV